MDVFHDIIFSYYLTATQTLTFGNIKWTPDVAFTVSFIDIVFGRYFRQGMQEKLPLNIYNESIVAIFARKFCPWFHVHFVIMRG